MTTVRTKLLFDTEAEDAARFYVSIFDGSGIAQVSRYASDKDACQRCGIDAARAGTVMNTDFRLAGRPFTAINGKSADDPSYRYNLAAVLLVYAEDADERAGLARTLARGGEVVSAVGDGSDVTVRDRFGVYWRVVAGPAPHQRIVPLFTLPGARPGGIAGAAGFYATLDPAGASIRHADRPGERTRLTLWGQAYEFACGESDLPGLTEAISSIILCATRDQLDTLWTTLREGGDGFNRQDSAWLVDRYGVWWQLLHAELAEIMTADPRTQDYAFDRMRQSELIDVEALKRDLPPLG